MNTKRNIIKYGSITLGVVIALAGIGIIVNMPDTSEPVPTTENSTINVSITSQNTDFNITMTVKNKEIELSETEKQKIVELCEESLENNKSLLNLILTKEQVDDFAENGVSLELEYKNEKTFTIMDYAVTVNKVKILIDDNHSYLMINDREFFGAFSNELYEMLKSCSD